MAKVKVVHGAPLSGKTSYVKANVNPGKDIVFDYDLILSALSFGGEYERYPHLHEYVLNIRKLIADRTFEDNTIKTVWIITTIVSDKLKKELSGHDVEYIELDPGIDEVLRRLDSNPGGRDKTLWSKYINDYYGSEDRKSKTSYTDREHNPFYNTMKWREKRIRILKRDSFECRECARYGRVTEANTVHHIKPLTSSPELRLDAKNLISVCAACHAKFHNRDSDELTDVGRTWVQRVWSERSPP